MAGKSNILIAAVAGLAIGIGLGMLIAPEKGTKTRKRINTTNEPAKIHIWENNAQTQFHPILCILFGF